MACGIPSGRVLITWFLQFPSCLKTPILPENTPVLSSPPLVSLLVPILECKVHDSPHSSLLLFPGPPSLFPRHPPVPASTVPRHGVQSTIQHFPSTEVVRPAACTTFPSSLPRSFYTLILRSIYPRNCHSVVYAEQPVHGQFMI